VIKILAIGNSFSEDATRYLHEIADAGGIETKVVNLYIGGCSLKRHCENIQNDAAAYEYQLNGVPTGRPVSIRRALLEDEWDIVTMQQVSHESGLIDSYFPWLAELSVYVRKLKPKAKQIFHRTWAYEIDSTHSGFANYGCDRDKMANAIEAATAVAAKRIGSKRGATHNEVPIIPCGDAIRRLRKTPEFDYPNGGLSLCRDGFHLDYVYGRYAAAAVWYEFLLGGDITKNSFAPDGANSDKITLIQKIVHEVVQEVKNR